MNEAPGERRLGRPDRSYRSPALSRRRAGIPYLEVGHPWSAAKYIAPPGVVKRRLRFDAWPAFVSPKRRWANSHLPWSKAGHKSRPFGLTGLSHELYAIVAVT